ncbi:uncharacterized protein LOC106156604 [Lingula anatina]|uniref:Uncharacterized protein LOC106156604 n=1 Tax=Lingula anatina TaxID=7574 RepID=A0A2R2MN32_LINAN|nr:uncharacterized protein LOC106156604 [Lingula anatina]|eukprot:XP_023931472.1 uncharacterized protein LOC106156604 [Lingula anatina]
MTSTVSSTTIAEYLSTNDSHAKTMTMNSLSSTTNATEAPTSTAPLGTTPVEEIARTTTESTKWTLITTTNQPYTETTTESAVSTTGDVTTTINSTYQINIQNDITFLCSVTIETVNSSTAIYSEGLNDTTSPGFRQLAAFFCNVVIELQGQQFQGFSVVCIVIAFRAGSIIADFKLQVIPQDQTVLVNTTDVLDAVRKVFLSANSSQITFGTNSSDFIIEDYNECQTADTNDCSTLGSCINTFGSYQCQCSEGFRDDNVTSPGRKCTEICESTSCSNNGKCQENGGNLLSCQCNEGFVGDQCDTKVLIHWEILLIAGCSSLAVLCVVILIAVFAERSRMSENQSCLSSTEFSAYDQESVSVSTSSFHPSSNDKTSVASQLPIMRSIHSPKTRLTPQQKKYIKTFPTRIIDRFNWKDKKSSVKKNKIFSFMRKEKKINPKTFIGNGVPDAHREINGTYYYGAEEETIPAAYDRNDLKNGRQKSVLSNGNMFPLRESPLSNGSPFAQQQHQNRRQSPGGATASHYIPESIPNPVSGRKRNRVGQSPPTMHQDLIVIQEAPVSRTRPISPRKYNKGPTAHVAVTRFEDSSVSRDGQTYVKRLISDRKGPSMNERDPSVSRLSPSNLKRHDRLQDRAQNRQTERISSPTEDDEPRTFTHRYKENWKKMGKHSGFQEFGQDSVSEVHNTPKQPKSPSNLSSTQTNLEASMNNGTPFSYIPSLEDSDFFRRKRKQHYQSHKRKRRSSVERSPFQSPPEEWVKYHRETISTGDSESGIQY